MSNTKKTKNVILIAILLIIMVAVFVIQNPFSERQEGIDVFLLDTENTGLNIGNRAPDFALKDVNGNVVQLSDSFGNKVVVINFWATWCPPCREEFVAFEKIFQEHESQLDILGVNLQENKEAVDRFLEEIPVSFTLLLDPNAEVIQKYNVFTQPITYFLDRDGLIVDKKFGPLTEQEIVDKFEKLGID